MHNELILFGDDPERLGQQNAEEALVAGKLSLSG